MSSVRTSCLTISSAVKAAFIGALLGLILVVAAVSGCRRSHPGATVFTGMTMGTTYTVKVVKLPDGVKQEEIEKAIETRLDSINAAMSTYREDSEVSRFNRAAANQWFPVSEETANVLRDALRIGEKTDGAFDVTIGPVLRLWHFGAEASREKKLPSDEAIAKARQCTGYSKISVRPSPPAIEKSQPDVTLDLSGIAKGYAVDEVSRLLDENGIVDFMVEIGGEVRAKGVNAHGVAWRIAVEKPLVGERTIQRVVSLQDAALATSGDYRIFFEIDGKRYSHVIDPRTARPVEHQVVSVTVVAGDCATADALATGLMVLGPDRGMALATKEELPVLFILRTEDGFVEKATPSFKSIEVQ